MFNIMLQSPDSKFEARWLFLEEFMKKRFLDFHENIEVKNLFTVLKKHMKSRWNSAHQTAHVF